MDGDKLGMLGDNFKFLRTILISIAILLFTPSLSVSIKPQQTLLEKGFVAEKQCLLESLWFEVRNQPREGILAVATVIKNRKEAKDFPNTFCTVIDQPRQFSYRNHLAPGTRKKIHLKNSLDKRVYDELHYISALVVQGTLEGNLPKDVLYYTKVGVQQRWMKRMRVHRVIDQHKFLKE